MNIFFLIFREFITFQVFHLYVHKLVLLVKHINDIFVIYRGIYCYCACFYYIIKFNGTFEGLGLYFLSFFFVQWLTLNSPSKQMCVMIAARNIPNLVTEIQ